MKIGQDYAYKPAWAPRNIFANKHLKILEKIRIGNESYALILEDDVIFEV